MASTYYCPNCRATVCSNDRFCSNCGVNLRRVCEQRQPCLPPFPDDFHYLHKAHKPQHATFNNQGWYSQAGVGTNLTDNHVKVLKKAEQYQKDNIHDHPLPDELKMPIRTEILKLL